MTSFNEALLDRLCSEFGIDNEYWDIWGRKHATSRQTKLSILASLGLNVSTPQSLDQAATEFRERFHSRPLDPVLVVAASAGQPSIPIRLTQEEARSARLSMAIYFEDGTAHSFAQEASALPAIRIENGDEIVAVQAPIPRLLPLGYHDLEVLIELPDGGGRRGSMRLISAPDRAWQPARLENGGGRVAGLAVSLYGVRSARNWGAGDFTDLRNLTAWVAETLQAAFVALNPLHALHNRQPYNTSPYLPLSSFYRNQLYLDVEAVPEFATCRVARRVVRHPRFQEELEALRDSEFVEYERVASAKSLILRALFRHFLRVHWERDTPRAREFRRWRAAEGDLLHRFATYCALDRYLHQRNPDLWIWPDWPACYQDPDSPAVRSFVEQRKEQVLFYEYVQWQIDEQLRAAQAEAVELGMPIGLYHDLALATDRCGSDLWAYRNHFVQGCRVGAPPDDFAPEGQDWAFPPPNALVQREQGYRLFVETIRKNSRHGGALRIDHVMRFFRLFWIPDGMPAMEGTYVNERWEDLLRILALESVRGRFLIVGEDLGTVPPALREGMARFGMLSYKLFYFEKGGDGLPRPSPDYPAQTLVSSTTHDLPTLAGFWSGRDIEARRTAGLIPDEADYQRRRSERFEEKRKMIEALVRENFLPAQFPREAAWWPELTGELHNAIIGYLVSTPAKLMLLNQEDLTKEEDQQNLPGTTWQYPNWRRKMRLSLEELEGEAARGFTEMFRQWLRRTGRQNLPPAD